MEGNILKEYDDIPYHAADAQHKNKFSFFVNPMDAPFSGYGSSYGSSNSWKKVDPANPSRYLPEALPEDDDPYLSPRSRLAGYVLNGGTEPA